MALKYKIWTPNFKKLNNDFGVLQNLELDLRGDDDDFADLTRIALRGRKGTIQDGQNYGTGKRVHSQIIHSDKNREYHIGFSGTEMRLKQVAKATSGAGISSTTIDVNDTTGFDASGSAVMNGDSFSYTGLTPTSFTGVSGLTTNHSAGSEINQWVLVDNTLTDDKNIGGLTFNSFSGTPVVDNEFIDEAITGAWTLAPSYGASTGVTKYTSAGANFPTDESLIGFQLFPNIDSVNTEGLGYDILSHSATEIVVAGDTSNVGTSSSNFKIKPISTSTTVIDQSQSWTKDQYSGFWVVITEGKGLGQARKISSNETNYLVFAFPWTLEPDETSKYSIYDPGDDDNVLYFGNGVQPTKKYDGVSVTELANRPKGNIISSYQDRIVIAGDADNPYSMYYSDINNYEYFDPTSVITPNGFDEITAHAVWNDRGIIMKENTIWSYTLDFFESTGAYIPNISEIPDAAGCVNDRCWTKAGENEIWYYTGKEVRILGAESNQIGVLTTSSASFPIDTLLSSVSREQAQSAYMDNDGIIIRLSIPDANLFFEYDLRYNVWLTRTGNSASSMVVNSGKQWFYGDSSDSVVYEMDIDGHLDDGGVLRIDGGETGGNAVDTIIGTKSIDGGSRAVYKKFRYVNYIFENNKSSFRHSVEIDTLRSALKYGGESSIGFNYSSGSGEFGESTLGDSQIGGSNPEINTFVIRKSVGRDPGITAKITARNNNPGERFTLIGLELYWRPKETKRFTRQFIT